MGHPSDDDDAAPLGFDGIHFHPVGEDESTCPTVGAVPVVFLVPHGMPAPHGLDLSGADLSTISSPSMRLWLESIQYVMTHHTWKSVTVGTPIFPPGAFGSPFPTHSIIEDVSVHGSVMIDEGDVHHGSVMAVVKESDASGQRRIADARGGVGGPGASQAALGLNPEAFVAAVKALTADSASRTTRTITQTEADAHAAKEDQLLRYKVAMGRLVVDPAVPGSTGFVVAAELTPEFHRIAACTNFNHAKRQLVSCMSARREMATASSNSIDNACTLDDRMWDVVLSRKFTEADWIVPPIVGTPALLKNGISPFAFLPIRTDGAIFQYWEALNTLVAAQLEAGVDNGKVPNRNSTLYTDGHKESLLHLRQTVSNAYVSLGAVVNDFHTTHMGKTFQAMERLLREPEVEHSKGRPPVLFHILLATNNVIQEYWKVAAKNPYRIPVASNEPFSGQAFLDGPQRAMETFEHDLRYACSQLDFWKFERTSAVYAFFYPDRVRTGPQPAPQQAAPPTGRPTGDTRTAPAVSRSSNQFNGPPGASTPGILVWKGDPGANIPKPAFLVQAPGSTRSSNLCMTFAVRGRTCRAARGNCKFAHIARVSDLSPEAAQKLAAFVASTAGLEFAEGQAPPSGTR